MGFLSVQPDRKFSRLPFEQGRVPLAEHLGNTVDDTLQMLPFQNLYKATELAWGAKNNEYNPVLTPEQANERWGLEDDGRGDGGVKFSKPINAQKAFLIHNYKLEERKRMDRLAKGNDTIGRQIGGLAAGLGAQALDPINLGLIVLFPGMSAKSTIALSAKTGVTAARVIQSASGVAVGVGVSEPFSYVSKMFGEQNEYGPKNTAMNVAAGMLLGTTINLGLGKIGDKFADTAKMLADTPARVNKKILNDAAEAVLNNEPINPSATVRKDVIDTLRTNSKRNARKMDADTDAGAGLELEKIDGPTASDRLAAHAKEKKAAAVKQAKKIAAEKPVGDQTKAPTAEKLLHNENLQNKLRADDIHNAPEGGYVYKYGSTEIFVDAFSIEKYKFGYNDPFTVSILKTGSEEEYQAVLWHILRDLDQQNKAMLKNKPDVDPNFLTEVKIDGERYSADDIAEFVTGKRPVKDELFKNKQDSNLDVESIGGRNELNHGGPNRDAPTLTKQQQDMVAANVARDNDVYTAFDLEPKVAVPKEAPAPKDAPAPKPKEVPDSSLPAKAQQAAETEAAAQAEFEKGIFDDFADIDDELTTRMEADTGRQIDDFAELPDEELSGMLKDVDEAAMTRLEDELDRMGYDEVAKKKILDDFDTSDISKLRDAIDQATDCMLKYKR